MTSMIPIQYTARDYDILVTALQEYILTNRPELWTDFTSANIGEAILEMISYIGEIDSFTANRISEEMYLTTSRSYRSGIRNAKTLGYVPHGPVAAAADVYVSPLPSQVATEDLTIAVGVSLQASGLTWECLTPKTIPAGSPASDYFVTLTEGQTKVDTFASDASAFQEFTTRIGNVANLSWSVKVNTVLWTQTQYILLAGAADQKYEVEYTDKGELIVRFGDGTTGALPPSGAVIEITYRTCSGTAGDISGGGVNGSLAATLSISGAISVTVANVIAAAGGADAETLDEIKRNAPMYFKTGLAIIRLEDYTAAAQAFSSVGGGAVARGYAHYRQGTLLIPDPGPSIVQDEFIPSSYQPYNFGNVAGVIRATKIAQMFTPTAVLPALGYNLRELCLYVKRVGNPGDIKVRIEYDTAVYKHDGALYPDIPPPPSPSVIVRSGAWKGVYDGGAVLDRSGIHGTRVSPPGILVNSDAETKLEQSAVLTTMATGWVKITFPGVIPLVAGGAYWIVLELENGSSTPLNNYWIIYGKSSADEYPGGRLMYYNGATWANETTMYDIAFRLFEYADYEVQTNSVVEFWPTATYTRSLSPGATITGTLQPPIKREAVAPGSVHVEIDVAGAILIADDDTNGIFVATGGSATILSSSIDYVTGDFTIVLNTAVVYGTALVVTYKGGAAYHALSNFELFPHRNNALFVDPNTIDVYAWQESATTFVPANSQLRQDLLDYLQANSVKTVTMFVHAGTPVKVKVVFNDMNVLADYDITDTLAAVEDALIAGFKRMENQPGTTMYVSDLTAIIEAVPGVDNFTLNYPTVDITFEPYELASYDPSAYLSPPAHSLAIDSDSLYGRY